VEVAKYLKNLNVFLFCFKHGFHNAIGSLTPVRMIVDVICKLNLTNERPRWW